MYLKFIVAGRDIIISQLADDNALFLKDHHDQVPAALKVVDAFSKAPSLSLHISKCELLSFKDCQLQHIANIQMNELVTYLGIVILKDQKSRCEINFDPILQKAKLNHRLLRDLSIKGRVFCIKLSED